MTRVQSFRPYLIGAVSACAVLALGLSREVHAVASALVTVVNTTANPVVTAPIDNRAVQAFGTRVFPSVRNYATIAVPANKRLVLTSVSGFNNGNGSVGDLEIDEISGGMGNATRVAFGTAVGPTFLRYLPVTPLNLVADPGTTVYFFIGDSDNNDTAGVNIDVHGYWVNAS